LWWLRRHHVALVIDGLVVDWLWDELLWVCEGRGVYLAVANWLFLLLLVVLWLSWWFMIVLRVSVFSIAICLPPPLIGSLFVPIIDAVVGLAVFCM
jgi:hypothetical protein